MAEGGGYAASELPKLAWLHGLSYATTTRRINRLLTDGRISATAPAHSQARTFVITE